MRKPKAMAQWIYGDIDFVDIVIGILKPDT